MGFMMFPFLSVLVFLITVSAENPQGCVEKVSEGVDLFPDKVAPIVSQNWSISYHNTYKILTNKIVNESYLLYQCGTEIPSSLVLSDFAAVVSIPVEKVGITQTPMITFLEQIEVRDKIGAFLSDKDTIWSACFAKDVESGSIALKGTRDNQTFLTGNSPPSLSEMVAFEGDYENTGFAQTIKISEYLEKTNQGIFEWALFFSAFFNKEDVAKQVTDAAALRFDCIKEQTLAVASDSGKKPVLLWGHYSAYCSGWDVGECPNYYCEFADGAGVDILSSAEGTNQEAVAKCGSVFMTTEEFVEFGKDADYWFFNANNINATLDEFKDALSVMKSVQGKSVFDYQGMGVNSWYEQRYTEYYNVLEDMGYTMGTIKSDTMFRRRHFWRNVFTEPIPADGINAVCTPETEANILSDPHECGPNITGSKSSATGLLGFATMTCVSLMFLMTALV